MTRHKNSCVLLQINRRSLLHFMGLSLSCRLKKISPASFRETCQWLKYPLNGLRTHSRVCPVVGLLPLASGPAYLGGWGGTGQQMAKLLERYTMMMMMMMMMKLTLITLVTCIQQAWCCLIISLSVPNRSVITISHHL